MTFRTGCCDHTAIFMPSEIFALNIVRVGLEPSELITMMHQRFWITDPNPDNPKEIHPLS